MNLRTRLGSLAIGVATCAALVAFPARAEIDRDTMVGLWLFDENGGAVTQDRSDGGHDGILKRAPVWTDGRCGSGMDFHVGKGSYVEIDESAADFPFGETDPFAITAWINRRTGGVVFSKFNQTLNKTRTNASCFSFRKQDAASLSVFELHMYAKLMKKRE